MRGLGAVLWSIFVLAIVGLIAGFLGMGGTIRGASASGHLLDWLMGVISLSWLVVVLKVPWDLYFEAQAVAFEIQRSKERQVILPEGREAYVSTLRRRLLWLALGIHAVSAGVVGLITFLTDGGVGYYFAGFYILSMAFRPAVAGYEYLSAKLRALSQEVRYPRDDVVRLIGDVTAHQSELLTVDKELERLHKELAQQREELKRETAARGAEIRVIREGLHSLGREFETAVSKLTNNQQVIQGVQAFVRLVVQASTESCR